MINRDTIDQIADVVESLTFSEIKALDSQLVYDFDFEIELNGNTWRFISEASITEIAENYCRDYADETEAAIFNELEPWQAEYLTFNTATFIDNMLLDGYGHLFAYYDSEEHEVNDYYMFRLD